MRFGGRDMVCGFLHLRHISETTAYRRLLLWATVCGTAETDRADNKADGLKCLHVSPLHRRGTATRYKAASVHTVADSCRHLRTVGGWNVKRDIPARACMGSRRTAFSAVLRTGLRVPFYRCG